MALAASDGLTRLVDAAARLLTETIATGRNKIFLCYLCLPRLAGAAVSRERSVLCKTHYSKGCCYCRWCCFVAHLF